MTELDADNTETQQGFTGWHTENEHHPEIDADGDVFCNCGESFVLDADADQEPEWDSQDSNAYQDRIEAGLEPDAEEEAEL
jgi:hypothetical protein